MRLAAYLLGCLTLGSAIFCLYLGQWGSGFALSLAALILAVISAAERTPKP